MATRSFALNTTPHVADVGGTELLFEPEVQGDAFVEALMEVREAQTKLTAADTASREDILAAYTKTVDFIRGFLLPESVEAFNNMQLPQRVLGQMVEFLMEVYGGGAGSGQGGGRPTGSSSGSASQRPKPGTRGRGN